MSIEDSIKRDHNEYRGMFAKLQKTTKEDVEERGNTFSTLRRKVFAHFIAEEITVFKDMLKVTEVRPLALELVEEHRAIRDLFDVLEATNFDDELWLPRLVIIAELFAIHLGKEESVVMSASPKYFSQAQLEALGKVFVNSETEEVNRMITEH